MYCISNATGLRRSDVLHPQRLLGLGGVTHCISKDYWGLTEHN